MVKPKKKNYNGDYRSVRPRQAELQLAFLAPVAGWQPDQSFTSQRLRRVVGFWVQGLQASGPEDLVLEGLGFKGFDIRDSVKLQGSVLGVLEVYAALGHDCR